MKFESKMEANLWLVEVLADSNWWLAPEGEGMFRSISEAREHVFNNPDGDMFILAPVRFAQDAIDALLTRFHCSDKWTIETEVLNNSLAIETSTTSLLSSCRAEFKSRNSEAETPPALDPLRLIH